MRTTSDLMGFVLMVVCMSWASATTYYVNGTTGDDSWDGLAVEWDGTHGPKKTIQAGINTSADTDTVIVADGTYTGAGNRNLDFGGKAITLESENGAATCIIDCENSGRGFYLHMGETSTSVVDGFTIQNGNAEFSTLGGGALLCCNDSSPTITDCIIRDNTADEGGGIFGYYARPAIVDCTVSGNTATDEGGGMCYIGRNPSITNCTISGNTAANQGGGIYCETGNDDPSPAVTNCTISGNAATEGGGIYYDDCDPSTANCIIAGNTATEEGGGIYCLRGQPPISNCIVVANTAAYGGGIACDNVALPSIVNCIISENTADYGGGIDCYWGSSPAVTNCTISVNTAYSRGGGINCRSNSLPTVTNCILWGDSPDEVWVDSGVATLTYCDIQGGYAGTGNIDADPLFLDAAAANYRLQSTSPCIDAGTSDGTPSEDKDGIGRWDKPDVPNTGGGTYPYYDIGAHEYVSFLYVSDSEGNDSYDGIEPIWDGTHGPKKTIQAGIDAALEGMRVQVADGTYTGTGNKDLDFGGKAITVQSENGAATCIIDCENSGRGFYFHSDETASSVIDGFTVTNGNVPYPCRGGGIYCSSSSPSITNCTISDNLAVDYGGGIYCDSGASPLITNCIISDNTSEWNGGGLYCVGASPSVTNCIINGNTAHHGGGGIYCDSGASPLITNCTISGNTAPSGGGGVYCYSASPTITNSILWGDSPDEVYLAIPPNPTFAYCNIQGGYPGTGNIDADPLFMDAAAANYRLQSTSPCIDAGTSDGTPSEDRDGLPRWDKPDVPNTGGGTYPYYDIGAHEYVSFLYVSDSEGNDSYDGFAPVWDGTHGPKKTIQAGIDAALEGMCVRVADGTYTGTGNKDLDFGGKTITVQSENGAATCIIDCENSGRGFYFHTGETTSSVIDGFTITNGNALDYGGGIYCDTGASPSVTNCTISGNSAPYGGGIGCLSDSNPTITNCAISHNTAYYDGGGIYCDTGASPSVTSCTISGNLGGGDGGGIHCWSYSSPTITSCNISHNSASDGGGISCWSSSNPQITDSTITGNNASNYGGGVYCLIDSNPTITNCTISGNTAYDDGGGIYCLLSLPSITNCIISSNWSDMSGGGIGCDSGASPSVTNCIISGNTADRVGGGGVFCHTDASISITNCIISGNSCYSCGGGIYCSSSSSSITNCIISDNLAVDYGGGIYCDSGASPSIANCTISGNIGPSGGGGVYCHSASPTITNSILWGDILDEVYVETGSPTLSYCNIEGGYAGTGNIDEDPLFCSGPLHDYYLSQTICGQAADSPCVDAGSDTAENLGLHRHTTRTDGMPDTGVVDMGYHVPYTLLIDSITGSGDDITIHWNAIPGVSYTVQWSDDMLTWNDVPVGEMDNWTAIGGALESQRYYRVLEE